VGAGSDPFFLSGLTPSGIFFSFRMSRSSPLAYSSSSLLPPNPPMLILPSDGAPVLPLATSRVLLFPWTIDFSGLFLLPSSLAQSFESALRYWRTWIPLPPAALFDLVAIIQSGLAQPHLSFLDRGLCEFFFPNTLCSSKVDLPCREIFFLPVKLTFLNFLLPLPWR